jgi:hypothetical protein
MLGRRQINATANSTAQLRSSLAHAAFAVEERVVWGGANILRSVVDAIRWPFERAAWAIERGLIWPLEERTGKLNGSLRAAGLAALALLAVGAGVLGLVWASGSGGGSTQQPQPAVTRVAVTPAVTPAPEKAQAESDPALQGAVPDFTPKTGETAAKTGGETVTKTSGEAADAGASATAEKISSAPSAAATATAEPAGPAATKVARQFAGAFVLYETGRSDAKVREVFAATATPQLTHALLQRPPRLPADAEVPKAKVLNIVPGPKHGDTYTLSVSLLRVGVSSELRIDMLHNAKSGEWQVTDVRG